MVLFLFGGRDGIRTHDNGVADRLLQPLGHSPIQEGYSTLQAHLTILFLQSNVSYNIPSVQQGI